MALYCREECDVVLLDAFDEKTNQPEFKYGGH